MDHNQIFAVAYVASLAVIYTAGAFITLIVSVQIGYRDLTNARGLLVTLVAWPLIALLLTVRSIRYQNAREAQFQDNLNAVRREIRDSIPEEDLTEQNPDAE